MKNNIPQYLQEKFLLKYAITTKFPDEIKAFMIKYSEFYGWNLTDLNKIFKLMKRGISELGCCEYKNCTNKKQIIWDCTITKGCCKTHNTKIYNLATHGVESHMQLEEYKKYGSDNIFSNNKFIQKKFKEKYGVISPQHVKEFQEKTKKTNLERYGCEWNIASDESRKKQAETNLEKYGVDNYVKTQEFKDRHEEIRNKIASTNLEKYGTEYPMQSTHCKNKYKATSVKNNGVEWVGALNKYKLKEYVWKTGEVSLVQGYEPQVLMELELSGITYNDIKVGIAQVPSFKYIFENDEKTYYPDFYIPSKNLIIEVKSKYTLQKEWEKNQAKFQAIKDAGFEFRLEVR